MNTFVKCRLCGIKIPEGEAKRCIFASHKRVIGGKEYVFCCAHCAETFEEKKK